MKGKLFSLGLRLLAAFIVLFALFAVPARPALAQEPATCTVINNLDDGTTPGSLRVLLADYACTTIDFNNDYIITLDSELGPLVVDRSVTIDGVGHAVTLSGGGLVRVLQVGTLEITFQSEPVSVPALQFGGSSITFPSGSVSVPVPVLGNGGSEVTLNLRNLSVVNGHVEAETDNWYGMGGGMAIWGATANISNVTFSGNQSHGDFDLYVYAPYGGGAIASIYGTLTLADVDLRGNAADFGGGGVQSVMSTVTLAGVNFLDNTAGFGGGGMLSISDPSLALTDVTFSGNSATIPPEAGWEIPPFGGGLLIWPLQPLLGPAGPVTLTDVRFSGNTAALGGGLFAGFMGAVTASLTNVTFNGNSALGIEWDDHSSPGMGGGMFFYPDLTGGGAGSATLTNVTFSNNSALATPSSASGGGGMMFMAVRESESMLTNVTVSGNSATYGGGIGILLGEGAGMAIRNSILWGNGSDEIYVPEDYAAPTVSYSDVELAEGVWEGTGNINQDPLFVDAAAGDLRLHAGSPAIDAGDQTLLPADLFDLDGDADTAEPIPFDLGGNPRVVGGQVDMGAYEMQTANTPPVANPGGPYLGAVNTPIAFDGSGSTDPDGDLITYAWAFGDGATGTAVAPSHTYAAAGIYDVCLTVHDGAENSTQICTIAVVYDPSGGFVTGGGWIDSPAGAYVADPALVGKATFGFVSKYKKGATVPEGNTEFQFKAGDLSFHSSSYDWLVVSGKDKAKFKGSGAINGAGNYGFMLTATDGVPDTFRIKIWDKANGDAVVYDNQIAQSDDSYAGTPLGGGSIVVHTTK